MEKQKNKNKNKIGHMYVGMSRRDTIGVGIKFQKKNWHFSTFEKVRGSNQGCWVGNTFAVYGEKKID